MAYCKEFVYPWHAFEAYLLTRSIENGFQCLVFAFVLITCERAKENFYGVYCINVQVF